MTPPINCEFCGGRCDDADLTSFLQPELSWFWEAIANAADRRGDPMMTDGGPVKVIAPRRADERSAAAGLIQTRKVPRPGQALSIPLDELTAVLQARGSNLTPAAVAAHATGRILALRAAQRDEQIERHERLRSAVRAACDDSPDLAGRDCALFEHLRRTGWVARLARREDAGDLIRSAVLVAAKVACIPPGQRYDRRLLIPEDPHALDDGNALSALALALLTAMGVISAAERTSLRTQWAQAGVDCDDLMGGLTVLGVRLAGWDLPAGAVCTLPPRILKKPCWAAPDANASWIFVTENPSILAAAADMVERDPSSLGHVKLICTMGTPSGLEIAAIGALALLGWNVAVRADFDPAGIRHVTDMLAGIPRAVPWRMATEDYADSQPVTPASQLVPPTLWQPELADAINASGLLAFEEALLPYLLDDLRRGAPVGAAPCSGSGRS